MKKNILAVFVICLAMTGLWFTNRTTPPKDVSWEDVAAEARAGSYKLITTQALFEKYTDPEASLLLVDTRQEWEFRTGHIQGAVNFSMEPTWLSRWQNRKPLHEFLGPDKKTTIVFY